MSTILATAYTLGDETPQIYDVYDMKFVTIVDVKAKIEKTLEELGYTGLTNWTIARNMTDSIFISGNKGTYTIKFSIRQTEVLTSI